MFWPAPNVDSGLVRLDRRAAPASSASRRDVFEAVDAAFAQRRKTLRSALAGWAGSAPAAEAALRAAGVDPGARGETLTVEEFARLAEHRPGRGGDGGGSAGTVDAGTVDDATGAADAPTTDRADTDHADMDRARTESPR